MPVLSLRRGLFLGVLLLSGAAASVRAAQGVPAGPPVKKDPFAAPVTPLAQLPETTAQPVHVRAILMEPPKGGTLILQEGSHRATVRTRRAPHLLPGDTVEAVGSPGRNGTQLLLSKALVRPVAPRKDGPPGAFHPLLQAVRDVRSLPPEKARQGHPVRVTGVVSFYDPTWNTLFVEDDTNGIFVNPGKQWPVRAGQRVEVTGFSAPGDFAPIVAAKDIRVVGGTTELAPPRAVPFPDLLTGREDSQRVFLEGVVRAAVSEHGHLTLEIAHGNYLFTAVLPCETEKRQIDALIDARVRVHGVCGTIFNKSRQIMGIRLFTQGLADVKVLDVPAADPFALPTATIASVLQFDPDAQPGRRVKVAGRVTWYPGGKALYLQDATGGLRVELDAPEKLPVGTAVEVVGFPAAERYTRVLHRAIVRRLAAGEEPAQAETFSPAQLQEGEHDAELVRVEARLMNVSRNGDGLALVLQSDNQVFDAFLDGPAGQRHLADLQPGSFLDLAGVCKVQRDWQGRPQSFRVLLRGPADVAVLERPPWWTARHSLLLLAGAGAVTLMALTWVVSLGRRVRHQTALIRERLVHETALEARYQDLVENATDIIFTTDQAGNLTSLNRAGEAATGYAREELLGRGLRTLLRAQDSAPLLPDLAKADQAATQEFRIRTKDRREIHLEVSTRPILQDGKAAGYQGIARDVTARKRAEAELQKARDAAEAASRAKSEFVANMSHEIRTPMNGILGMTELALGTDLTDEQREYLTTVRASGEALLCVINDVLDFSKIEAGKLALDPDVFGLRDCVGNTLKPLALRAHQKGVELACRVHPDVPDALVGDAARLRQVLINLAGNAIKFTQQGEVVLTVSLGAKDQGQRATDEEEITLHFAVTDTGIGIPADKLGHIFDPFEQADSSLTRGYGGTGLGLTISRRLAELMGGRVWAESEVGKGSTFHLTARFALQALSPSLVMARRPVNLSGITVLVVDDNATNRRILGDLTSQWEMRPTVADGGPAALAALRKAAAAGEPFPLVLLDAVMPGMDGPAVAREIARHPDWGRPHVLVLSSAGGPEGPGRRDSSVAAYLTKPVTQTDLLRAIQNALGKSLVDARGRPVLPADAQSHPAAPQAPSRRLRVLLAEDNLVNQRLGALLLERLGHAATVAGDGKEALAVLEREEFDLVLMDVQMPEMDGLEATRTLRRREAEGGRRLPVLALTAYAMKGDKERCLDAGMDGYLSKPIDEKELRQAIHSLFPATGNAESPHGDDPCQPA
jgi:PAS domain S-box-containing protein